MITHYASITRHLRVMVFNAFIVTLVINVTKPAPIEKRSSEPRRNVNSLGRTPPRWLHGGLGACTHTQFDQLFQKKMSSQGKSTAAHCTILNYILLYLGTAMGTARRDNKLPWLEGGGYLLVNYTKLVIYASFACQLHFNGSITQNSSFTRHLRVNYTLITYLHHYASLIVNYTSNTRFHILHAN